MPADEAPRPRGRSYGIALAFLAGGALLSLVSFSMTWAVAQVPLVADATNSARGLDLTGRDLLPWAGACGWVALAGLAGIVATRGWGRRAVAALVAIAGAVILLGSVWFAIAGAGLAADAAVAQGGAAAVSVDRTPAWILAFLGGVAVVGSGLATFRRGVGWPVMGARYERPTGQPSSRAVWDLQDMGQDPTDEPDATNDLVE